MKMETKQLIGLKVGEKFRVPRTGDICKVFNRYDNPRIDVYNETKEKRVIFKGSFWVIPIPNI